jgi:hypothetical protein
MSYRRPILAIINLFRSGSGRFTVNNRGLEVRAAPNQFHAQALLDFRRYGREQNLIHGDFQQLPKLN